MAGASREQRYRTLIDLGIALSAERNHSRLMEMILQGARSMTDADGGTLYLVTEARDGLKFEIIFNDTLAIAMGGSTGKDIGFPPVRLTDDQGQPNHKNVASHCAITGQTVAIADAYNADDFDFSGTKAFDKNTGYRSKSFLTVPLKDHAGEVMGVLQLINARNDSGKVVAFPEDIVPLIEALASQAAVALDNAQLIETQKSLFKSFIRMIAGAIDAKSPYTGGHCNRVPLISQMLAEAACAKTDGPFKDFTFTDDEWYELEIAADLHDCGKITTPESIVDKATKLESIYNRIHEIRMRFEVLKRDAVIECLERRVAGEADKATLEARLQAKLDHIDQDFAFVAECNVGDEFMAPEKVERLRRIAEQTWTRTMDDTLGLSHEEVRLRSPSDPKPPVVEKVLADKDWHVVPHDTEIDIAAYEAEGISLRPCPNKYNRGELHNLSISRGTLTAEDRFKINEHIVHTIFMLKELRLPKHLARVPEWAGCHHEKMDGTGYPKGLTREDMSVPARMMAIADVFEALTACDRPYKKAKTLSEALRIMSFMVKDKHLDPELWQLFLTSGVWQRYAKDYLNPEQVDAVDIAQYLPKAAE